MVSVFYKLTLFISLFRHFNQQTTSGKKSSRDYLSFATAGCCICPSPLYQSGIWYAHYPPPFLYVTTDSFPDPLSYPFWASHMFQQQTAPEKAALLYYWHNTQKSWVVFMCKSWKYSYPVCEPYLTKQSSFDWNVLAQALYSVWEALSLCWIYTEL